MRRTQWRVAAVALLVTAYVVAVGVRLAAAPRPRPEAPPAPAPERVAGLYQVRMDSPTVEVAGPDGTTRTVWLVWATRADEANALGGRRAGDPLVAVGRCGVGGEFWYCWVESLETP